MKEYKIEIEETIFLKHKVIVEVLEWKKAVRK